MTEWIKTYVLTLIGASVVMLLADSLLPSGKIRSYARFAMAVLLSVCIMQPLISKIPEINFDFTETESTFDFTQAVEMTVHGVSGFENADVSIVQNKNHIEEIHITVVYDKLLESAKRQALGEYLKNSLSAIYGVDKENIFIGDA